MKGEVICFESGEEDVFGVLHGGGEDRPLVLLLHGYGGNHQGAYYSYVDLAERLSKKGFNVLRFDFRGSGNSDGDFADQRLSTMVEDVESAVSFINDSGYRTADIHIVGHSKGGTVAIMYAAENTSLVSSITLWATVADYRKMWEGYEEERKELEEKETHVSMGFEVPVEVFFESESHDLERLIADVEAPALFIHGTEDKSVPFEHSEILYDAVNEPKKFVSIDGANHIFYNPHNREKAVRTTAEFIDDCR